MAASLLTLLISLECLEILTEKVTKRREYLHLEEAIISELQASRFLSVGGTTSKMEFSDERLSFSSEIWNAL